MDSQGSASVHHHQQEQPQPPRGHGSMASPPNPPPHQPYQQEQQQPSPHGHGAMEETPTLPPPPPPPQPQNHQQEHTNSYMLPAKISHQPQQPQKRGQPKKSFDDGLRFSPTLNSKSPRASPSENPFEKSHGRLLRSIKKQQPQALVMKNEDSNVGGGDVASSENPAKKPLEKLSCFGNKQMQKDLGVVGSGWMPHLIPINIGEDIVRKVVTFTEQGPRPRIVRIISASGLVSDVTLRNFSICGRTITYEGQFVIISLSGSFLSSENNGRLSITGDLSVSLFTPNNKVLSGVISGSLKAISPAQVVLFTPQSLDKENPESEAPSSSLPPNVLNYDASVTKVASPSWGTSSDIVDENGDIPLNRE